MTRAREPAFHCLCRSLLAAGNDFARPEARSTISDAITGGGAVRTFVLAGAVAILIDGVAICCAAQDGLVANRGQAIAGSGLIDGGEQLRRCCRCVARRIGLVREVRVGLSTATATATGIGQVTGRREACEQDQGYELPAASGVGCHRCERLQAPCRVSGPRLSPCWQWGGGAVGVCGPACANSGT